MNKLNPLVKKIMTVAHRAERTDLDRPIEPPSELVARVLRGAACPPRTLDLSLLEFMVKRTAAISAALGAAMISLQFLAGGTGTFYDALTHSTVLLRGFLP